MEKKYNRSRIGEEFTTNEGYTCKVIDGSSKIDYCTIQIDDWISQNYYRHVKNGAIKYPYHPSVFNIGYLGEDIYTSRVNKKPTKAYTIWTNMFRRCYDIKCQERQPTYKGITIDEEWHNFQNFAKWFYEESNYREGWELDKDLLSVDTKVYSPKTCIFIPKVLNSFLANKLSSNKSNEIGVDYIKSTNKWRAQIRIEGKKVHLGTFKNKQIAALTYKLARKKEANKWKEKMKGTLPQQAINNIK